LTVVFYALTDLDLCLNRLPIAHHLRDAGYRVVFVGTGLNCAADLEAEGFEFHVIASAGRNVIADVSSTLQLKRTLKQIKPDILHTFGLHAALRGGLAARFAPMSWVVHSVTAPPGIKNRPSRLLQSALRHAEVTFLSKRDRDAFIARAYARPEQTHVLRSTGVDLREIPTSGEPERTPVAALVSTPSGAGLQAFADAAQAINEVQHVARFAFIGPAPYPEIKTRLHRWQEEGRVEWWGMRDDLTAALGAVHVICLPFDFGELATLQACAIGRPIVALGDGVDREIIRSGENGYIVPADDSAALTASLRELVSNEEKRKRMGGRARALVESDYSAARVAQEIMVVYERLFEKGRFV
jgi:glycosyltransferase involved in cell wall biosynthesis